MASPLAARTPRNGPDAHRMAATQRGAGRSLTAGQAWPPAGRSRRSLHQKERTPQTHYSLSREHSPTATGIPPHGAEHTGLACPPATRRKTTPPILPSIGQRTPPHPLQEQNPQHRRDHTQRPKHIDAARILHDPTQRQATEGNDAQEQPETQHMPKTTIKHTQEHTLRMDSPHPLNKAIVLMLGNHTQLHARIDIAKEIARLRHHQRKARRRDQHRLDHINRIVVLWMHRSSVAKPGGFTHRVQGGRQAACSSSGASASRNASRKSQASEALLAAVTKARRSLRSIRDQCARYAT